jgi:hypothetical protein
LAKYIPLANTANGAYEDLFPEPSTGNQFLWRVDHHFSSKNFLNIRYFRNDGNTVAQSETIPNWSPNPAQLKVTDWTLHDTETYSAALLNEFHIGINRNHSQDWSSGTAQLSTYGAIFPGVITPQLPSITVTGYFAPATADRYGEVSNIYQTDWIAVEANGQPRRHWAMPALWVTCALGPYNFEFMTSVIQEIMTLYKVDGIFANRWSGSGICYGEHCWRNFREFSGLDLPRTTGAPGAQGGRGVTGAPSEAQSQYTAWERKRLLELYSLWDAEIRKRNPDAAFFPNGFDQIRDGTSVPILFADRQGRSENAPPWQNGKFAKDARSTFGSKPLDQRWLKPVEDLFVWHWKNEKYMRNERPLARIGLVSAQQAAPDHTSGFYHALVEARIPFEMVPDSQFDSARVQQFKVLALPNIANLSDAQCAQLKSFVEKGGGLVEICTAPGLRAPLMTVPTYPDLPMEEVYQRETKTDIPGVMVRSAGAGRVVYFPWDIDRTFWEVMNQDHGIVLANAVRWAANEEQPLHVQGPGVLDVALWKQQSSITVHLVNSSNPMMMKGPFREILPIGPQKVRVRLPDGAKAREVKFLVSAAKPQWRQSGAWIETTTPLIELHEVVAIDL